MQTGYIKNMFGGVVSNTAPQPTSSFPCSVCTNNFSNLIIDDRDLINTTIQEEDDDFL